MSENFYLRSSSWERKITCIHEYYYEIFDENFAHCFRILNSQFEIRNSKFAYNRNMNAEKVMKSEKIQDEYRVDDHDHDH